MQSNRIPTELAEQIKAAHEKLEALHKGYFYNEKFYRSVIFGDRLKINFPSFRLWYGHVMANRDWTITVTVDFAEEMGL